jgi:Family of unknown function (DUF6941)
MSDPYCLAMVLCDAIHVDATTGKQTILGTFSTVGAEQFPTKLNFAVYFAVTDAPSGFELTFRMVDSRHGFDEDCTPVFQIAMPMNSPSPLAVLESRVFLRQVLLSDPGVYHCELLSGESVLMSRRLVAVRTSDLEGKNNDL